MAGVLLVCCGLIYCMLRWFEHSQVYHPTRTFQTTGAELGRPFEDVWFTTADGIRLNGWFFPAQTNSARERVALLYCHGNGGNISHRLGICAALLETGASVLVFDYRGYGRSDGRPGEEGTYRDAQAAYQWLRSRGFGGTNIVAFGESLGGGVAAELAARETLGGLVLQSTFMSVPDLGRELFPWLPVRLFSTIKYDTRRKLPGLRLPVLVMHSRGDNLVPFRHGQGNFEAANQPKQFCELQGGHNDPLTDRAAFTRGLDDFLKRLDGR